MATGLFDYLQKTQLLLNDPNQTQFNRVDLISYVNTARNQVAGEGECVRSIGALSTVIGQRTYAFSGITLSGSGIAAALNVRKLLVGIGGGLRRINSKGWERFANFYLSRVVPPVGIPEIWAQFAQGLNGSIYVDPIPDAIYALTLDTVCVPTALAGPNDPEAIPSPWTDAIPYFTAYMALLTAQRAEEALSMYGIYEMFMKRARQMGTPTVLPMQYEGFAGARGASTAVPVTGDIAAMAARRRGAQG